MHAPARRMQSSARVIYSSASVVDIKPPRWSLWERLRFRLGLARRFSATNPGRAKQMAARGRYTPVAIAIASSSSEPGGGAMQQLGLNSGKVKFDARRQLAGKLAATSRTKSRRWRNRRSILPAAMTSVGVGTVFFTLVIGSLASFAIGQMRIRYGWLLSNAALLTYVIPASFLAIPFYRIMQIYGLTNNLWSVIAAMVTFATS